MLRVQVPDRRVPDFVRGLQAAVAVLLRPRDLCSFQDGGDPAATVRALDAGEVVERALGRLVRERELGVAEHLASFHGDEDRLGPVATPAHVALEPFVELADVGLLLAGDVPASLARDLPEPFGQFGALGPGDDLDPGGGSTAGASIAVRSSTIREFRPASS